MSLRKLFLSIVSAVATLIAGQQLALAADKPASESANTIEEIVVTARKREESILETPIAIKAITGDDLAAMGVNNFNQLADAIPGLNLSNISAGAGRSDRSFQAITLRGIVPSTVLSTLTATFIDGVPVASPTAIANVSDPARIEVLKGPQAAYFGRNTFAGAVNVVNREPGQELGGSFSLMGGSRSNLDFQGSIDGPLFNGKFGFRVSAHYFKKDGSYDNAANPSETLGDQETRSINGLLTANFSENFSGKLFVLYSEDDDGAPLQGMASAFEVRAVNGVAVGLAPGSTTSIIATNGTMLAVPAPAGTATAPVIIPNLSNCTVNGLQRGIAATETVIARPWFCGAVPRINSAFSPAQNTLSDSLLAASLADPRHRVVSPSQGTKGYGLAREYRHAHLNLDYKFGESGFILSSLTGINAEYWSELADLDNYNTSQINNPSTTSTASNRRSSWDFPFVVERETFDFSQELRLAYDKQGPFTGVFGAAYLKTTIWNELVNIQAEVLNAGNNNPGFGTANRDFLTGGVGLSTVETKSAFFGATYQLTDTLKASLEGRYQSDFVVGRAPSIGANIGAAAAAAFGIRAGAYAGLATIVDKKYNNFLPRFIVQYDFLPNLMGYASYSKGVNVGTNTFNTAFLGLVQQGIDAAIGLGLSVVQKPEKITNYEIGLKGKFLDGRLTLQSSAYSAKWTDQLNNAGTLFTNPANGQITQVTGLLNTGDVKLQGLEVELQAKPTSHLDLNFAVALTDTSVVKYAFVTVSQISGVVGDGFKGKQLPGSSKLSMNAGIQYSSPFEAIADGRWFARADLSWKDKIFADASNQVWIKARTVVNLRAGISSGKMGVDVFVLNAFDDKNYTSVAEQNVLTPNFALTGAYSYLNLSLPELRTYGARVTYKF